MIRKPTEKDFREGTAVTVLRETKRVSVASGQGVAKGIGRAYLYFFGVLWAFGIGASLISFAVNDSVIPPLIVVAVVFIGVLLFKAGRKYAPRGPLDALIAMPMSPEDLLIAQPVTQAPKSTPRIVQHGIYRLDRPKLIQKAVMLAIPAILMLSFAFVLEMLMMIAGVIMLTLAMLLVHRAFSDTKVLQFDQQSVKVVGLLGEGELLWTDVDDIFVRNFSRFNLYALFMSGARRNLVIAATRNRLDGFLQLLLPVDLLELDEDGLVQLVTTLLCCRAAGGEVVPSWQRTAAPIPATESSITPASDPRDSFDPDAIMARYMAEREQIIANARPDLQPTVPPVARKTFGRKTV